MSLLQHLQRRQPPEPDPGSAIAEGRVLVDGAVVTNPASLVRPDARVVVQAAKRPRGLDKLGPVLDRLEIDPAGRCALDVGACTGGFTQALLDRGARRVFAVDVGFGQLLGSLRQNPKVVNLERTNASDLSPDLLGEKVDLIVIDVTYVRLGTIIEELTVAGVAQAGTELLGLVKPMFELDRGDLPDQPEDVAEAGRRAADAARGCGWEVLDVVDSPLRGSRGAAELFLHARLGAGTQPANLPSRGVPRLAS